MGEQGLLFQEARMGSCTCNYSVAIQSDAYRRCLLSIPPPFDFWAEKARKNDGQDELR